MSRSLQSDLYRMRWDPVEEVMIFRYCAPMKRSDMSLTSAWMPPCYWSSRADSPAPTNHSVSNTDIQGLGSAAAHNCASSTCFTYGEHPVQRGILQQRFYRVYIYIYIYIYIVAPLSPHSLNRLRWSRVRHFLPNELHQLMYPPPETYPAAAEKKKEKRKNNRDLQDAARSNPVCTCIDEGRLARPVGHFRFILGQQPHAVLFTSQRRQQIPGGSSTPGETNSPTLRGGKRFERATGRCLQRAGGRLHRLHRPLADKAREQAGPAVLSVPKDVGTLLNDRLDGGSARQAARDAGMGGPHPYLCGSE
eukprot:gene11828-8137_t